jgi:hypothetical protein
MRSTKETSKETGVSELKDDADAGFEHQVIDQKEGTARHPGEAVITQVVTAAQDEKAPAAVDKEVANDGEPAVQQGRGEQGTSSSFARLVKGWEALAEAGARNVQRARENESFQPLQILQSLSLCGAGEGLARIGGNPQIGGSSGDPFEPIVLRHTHSTPLQYTPMFPDDDGGHALPPIRLEHMSRSRSTPSTSAFRQRSEGSAFGTHLRSMPFLGGPDDRSAFTLPARHNSFASLSDSGVRYSAFAPVKLPQTVTDATENTAIEVMDVPPATAPDVTYIKEEKDQADVHSTNGGSRAARFLRMSDARMLRKKRRSGRENPARPASISSSSPGTENKSKTGDSVDEESISPKSANRTRESTTRKSTIDIDISTTNRAASVSFPSVHETDDDHNANRADAISGDQYQQLDSDIDEEYEHYQRIETSLQSDSPTPIPSPAYQQFEDEQAVTRTESTDNEGDARAPKVRIEVSTGQATEERGSGLLEGSSLTPVSQDSANQSSGTSRSMMTGNTSAGHTTLATSTSATVSSGHMSVLSSVSETDIEVMETNQAGKMRIRQQRKLDQVIKGDVDSSMSVHSFSTGSTNTHGYVALAGSPAPLRDGASLPVDRFFMQSSIPVRHSASTNSGSTRSSGSATGPPGGVSKASDTSASPSKKIPRGLGSPATVSSEMAHTSSSSSSGTEEPPKFVSYLDRATNTNPLPPVDDDEERASPAEIVGYSEMVFEAATSTPGQTAQQPALIRPLQKRDQGRGDRSRRSKSRPPLSPIKGLRTPTTPPPLMAAVGGPDSTSSAYHQLSPPRNIIDHRIGAGLSKPYVLRSSVRPGDDGRTPIFVSPESDRCQKATDWEEKVVTSSLVTPEGAGPTLVYTYTASDSQRLGLVGPTDPEGDLMYEAMSIEVKDTDENASTPSPPLVSPEKGA